MKKLSLSLIIILNLLSTAVWGGDFLVNYYHKGVIVHTQQVVEGEPIGALPELSLTSCNNEINIFVGWIAETDIANYQTANTATPIFITENYIPTANTNLYALFADGKATADLQWQRVKSKSELKDNDQIIIAANGFNYAIGKTINKDNRLVGVEITKSADRSIITPTEDVQIFTLEKISNNLWGIRGEEGYLGNATKENTITYYSNIKDWTSWGLSFKDESGTIQLTNNYTSYPPYLYFNDLGCYFACRKSSIANLAIYKQSAVIVNYLTCTTPEAVEYTITLHDGDNRSDIKCMSDASILEPAPMQETDYWQLYGWTTTPVTEKTEVAPDIVTFPYTPTGNVDLYAVYYSTTSDSLIMQDKTIPYGWRLNETRKYNKYVSLEENNNLIIPHLSNITKIEIDMTKNSTYEQILFISNTTKDTTFFAQATTNSDKVYTFEFDSPTSTSLFFYTKLSGSNNIGVFIRKIIIHKQPIYSPKVDSEVRHIVSFNSNNINDQAKHHSISQTHNKNVKLPKNVFTNDLDFICWNTEADGSGVEYADEATINNIEQDVTLYAQWGEVEVVDVNEILEIEEDKEVDRLEIEKDRDVAVGEIIVADDATLSVAKNIVVDFTIDSCRYHFFSLPFNCHLNNVEIKDNSGNTLSYASSATDGDWVICRYDQTLAANNAGDIDKNAWVEILDKEYVLKANQGYIVGYFGDEENVVVKFTSNKGEVVGAPGVKIYNLGSDYEWYTAGENLSANGWNLIGQPYYETLRQGNLTQYVTIPNSDGKTYTQCLYIEALIDGLITPFSAFFVQLKDNVAPTIKTEELDYALYDGEEGFGFIDIYLSGNKDFDRTSLFNANQHTADYEIGSDLKKWIGCGEKPQIYTIEKGIPLAYNIQKIEESTKLIVGVYVPKDGNYTFSANENCGDLYLVDKQKNIITNLAQENYEVWLLEGKIDNRFEICFQKMTSTQLTADATKIEYFVKNGTVFVKNIPQNGLLYIYDCTGKMINKTELNSFQLPFRGLYHIIVKIGDKKHKNFSVIY